MSSFTVFFSNQLEVLYGFFKKNLFTSAHPFEKRIVVVEGPAMQEWLMQKMAEDPDLAIAMGIEFIYFKNFLERFYALFHLPCPHLPSKMELALGIEAALRTFCAVSAPESKKIGNWESVFHYLQGSAHLKKNDKRMVGLSHHLAEIFEEYSRFGVTVLQDWQKDIWDYLFTHTHWTTQTQLLRKKLPQSLSGYSIHFFSISFMSGEEFHFLERLSGITGLSYYILSPCALFWSDIRSDKERAFLRTYWEKKVGAHAPALIQLEEWLRARNPLLANFGRLGRELVRQIEESSAQTQGYYRAPLSEGRETDIPDLEWIENNSPPSLLQSIQTDILLMDNPEEAERRLLDDPDDSIQVHIAPNAKREIQILYAALLKQMDRDPALKPRAILVMAPSLEEYIPYIEAIFGAEDSQIHFQLLNWEGGSQTETARTFFQLLSLADTRWESADLLRLFEMPHFQRRHQLSVAECKTLRSWVEKLGMDWGIDLEHCRTWLNNRGASYQNNEERAELDSADAVFTWEGGTDRLLLGLALMPHHSTAFDHAPFEGVDFSHADLIGKWLHSVKSLYNDLKLIQDQSKMTLQGWSDYLCMLLDAHLAPDADQITEIEDYEKLKQCLKQLNGYSETIQEITFSFESIKIQIETLLNETGRRNKNKQLQAVRFCSFQPLKTLPAQVIALIGMTEENFPRHQEASALNLRTGEKHSLYCPSQFDLDRYLFLETLHAAQKQLFISYHEGNFSDKIPTLSLVVQELFSYLDRFYTSEGKKPSSICIKRHPFDAFHPVYFQQNSVISNFSPSDFQLAQTITGKKTAPHAFIPSFPNPISTTPARTESLMIDLNDLKSIARNPIAFHFKQTLGIPFQRTPDRVKKTENRLKLDALKKYQFREDYLDDSLAVVLSAAEKKAQLPFGPFKKVAKNQLVRESLQTWEYLNTKGIDQTHLFTIELCESCVQPRQLDEKHWLFPPLCLTCEGTLIEIIGKIPHVSAEGLVIQRKGDWPSVWRAWPEFLLYCAVALQFKTAWTPSLLFTQDKQVKTAFFPSPLIYLEKLVAFRSICLQTLCPLLPEWIPAILQEDPEAIQEKFTDLWMEDAKPWEKEAWQWVFHSQSPFEIGDQWKTLAKDLVEDLMQAWFPKRSP